MGELSTKTKIIFGLYVIAGVILVFMSGMFFSAMLIRPMNPFINPIVGVGVLIFSGVFSLTCAFCVWTHNKYFKSRESE